MQTDYLYDAASQITEESRSGYTCNYTYDFNGNRLTRTIAGGISETYSYTDEKLMRVEWNGGSSYKDYTYDAADRVDSIDDNTSVRTFAYDDESRLTSISGAYSATHEYNGFNTRTEKTEASVTRTFMRDGVGPTSPVLNDGAAAYTPGTSERRGGTTTYMHSGIKNADLQTNTSEVQTGERVYDAFGNLTASSGSFVGPFGYGGQFGYQEDGSGLKLLGNRYYDPSIGRFLTPDPIKDGNNWFAYCGNNPVTAYDATGLKPGDKYKSPEEAARAALEDIYWMSVLFNREYGGWIYRNEDGTYSYTFPVTGTIDRVSTEVLNKTKPKNKKSIVGVYHSHGAYDEAYPDSDNLSPEDRLVGIANSCAVWLITPGGEVVVYTPAAAVPGPKSRDKEERKGFIDRGRLLPRIVH